jgi:predicted dehydrogenase
MIKILLVGASGYGAVYLHFLFKKCKETDYRIAGIVDPYVEKSPFYDILKNQGIPFYDRMEDFYESRKADLAVIASPIHFHALQTEIALKNGSNVLCEKPVCAGPEDIEKMASFKEKYEGFVAVGYQWSFSQAILDLKKDILSGLFGKAEYLKTLVSWPRSHAYFNRNNWAGKIKTEDGRKELFPPFLELPPAYRTRSSQRLNPRPHWSPVQNTNPAPAPRLRFLRLRQPKNPLRGSPQ